MGFDLKKLLRVKAQYKVEMKKEEPKEEPIMEIVLPVYDPEPPEYEQVERKKRVKDEQLVRKVALNPLSEE